MDRAPGAVFGRYRIAAEPAYYGAGSLLAARELRTDEPRTLWLLMPHVVSDPEARERVVQVARVLRRLESPHVVRLHEFGEIDGQPFFALGSVHGLDLAELSDPDGFGAVEALDVIAQIGTGVDHLHHAGIVDGALGPRRVVVTEEDGVVRALLRDAGVLPALLPTSALFGSQKQEAVDFGAPELQRGEAPTVRSDVYSLGAMLWLALTGTPPYPSYVGHRTGAVPQVAGDGPVEEAVNAVLRKAMAKDPAERYRDAGVFVGTVRAIAALAREVGPDSVPTHLVRRDEVAGGEGGELEPELDRGPEGEPTGMATAEPAGEPTGEDGQPVPDDVRVEPALQLARDHWDGGGTISVRRRRSAGPRALLVPAVVALLLGALVLAAWLVVRDGRFTPGSGGALPSSSPSGTTGAERPADAAVRSGQVARLFPIAEKGDCVEDTRTREHRLERWTCERRGYRVVLTRWDSPSNATALAPHGGRRAAREPWELAGAPAGTQWTWRASGDQRRYRWTAVYSDVAWAVIIEGSTRERRHHAREQVAFRPSTALG